MTFFAHHIQNQTNTIKGGLYGLLLGDAVGRSFEFKSAEQIPPFLQIDMAVFPPNFRQTYPDVPIGTWTDDGSQTLALLHSLTQNNCIDIRDFAGRLCNWLYEGQYTPDGIVFDCGIQTSQALDRIRYHGTSVEDAAGRDEYANGNGALMRVLPIALWHKGSDEEMVRMAIQQGIPTHGHIRSGIVCAFYCLTARRLIQNRLHYQPDYVLIDLQNCLSPIERQELELILNAPQRKNPQGTGYVVDAFWSAIHALESQNNFADVIRSAIAFGNDTDTTAAIAGGLAGLKYGFDDLPEEWIVHLRGKEIVEELFAPLESRIREQIAEEISLLLEFRSFAEEYRRTAFCNSPFSKSGTMAQGLRRIIEITQRPFWKNRLYHEYFPQKFFCNSNDDAGGYEEIAITQLEQITAYITFINRCDHFTATPIFDSSFDDQDGNSLSTEWHSVIMAGRFEIILGILSNELKSLEKPH